MDKKSKEWEKEWTYTYNDLSVDFERLQKQLKGYLEKRGFKIRVETPPSDSGFSIMTGKNSKLKISKLQLALEVTGNPDSFNCIVHANEGEKLNLEASKWNLKVTETIQQLKNTKTPTTTTKANTTTQQAKPTAKTPTKEGKLTNVTLEKPTLLKNRYYQELSEVLLKTIESQGYTEAVPLRTFQVHLREKAPNIKASTKDIEKALQILEKRGLILGVKTLPDGLKLVEITLPELTEDLTTILKLTENQQYTTIEEIARKTGWPIAKAEQALNRLEKLGITRKVEGYKTGTRWHFPNSQPPQPS